MVGEVGEDCGLDALVGKGTWEGVRLGNASWSMLWVACSS